MTCVQRWRPCSPRSSPRPARHIAASSKLRQHAGVLRESAHQRTHARCGEHVELDLNTLIPKCPNGSVELRGSLTRWWERWPHMPALQTGTSQRGLAPTIKRCTASWSFGGHGTAPFSRTPTQQMAKAYRSTAGASPPRPAMGSGACQRRVPSGVRSINYAKIKDK